MRTPSPPTTRQKASVLEVLLVFFQLGLTSFGGPAAHLGYFREEFVGQRQWLDDKSYSDLVALCQFLPGPASSQVGMALGFGQRGWLGAIAAWIGFTLPSALALILFALGISEWEVLAQSGAIHGLKIAAVAIVAQAVWGMSKSLCPDKTRAWIAVVATLIAVALPSSLGQILAILIGGMAGLKLVRVDAQPLAPHRAPVKGKTAGVVLLGVFSALLFLLPPISSMTGSPVLQAFSDFYQAGALVFGGGHVVLPLLQASVVPTGLVSNEAFLAGYGATQTVPGPLFTFAAYLGSIMPAPMGGWIGGLTLLFAIFLPGFLLVMAALPYWESLRQRVRVQQAMAGVNAAVVGILAAALYDPVWTSAIQSKADFGLAFFAFALLVHARLSPVLVVLLTAAGGWLLAQ
ncbi:chromate efflux transporter [Comamonas jiangduensis]|uniref:chromate efflux transporter n=1 Tax=Comamonas jiangduensis TaxID=1194168 RepID=UPI003BF919E6